MLIVGLFGDLQLLDDLDPLDDEPDPLDDDLDPLDDDLDPLDDDLDPLDDPLDPSSHATATDGAIDGTTETDGDRVGVKQRLGSGDTFASCG